MTDKQIVANALEQLEKEKQEREISKIKSIVREYLERIDDKEQKRKELDVAIKELKSDLEDLKLGRLDKIEERQEKDENHNKHTIIIIKRVEKEYIPYQPWRSPWMIEWKNVPYSGSTITYCGGTGITNTSSDYYLNATNCSNNLGMITGTLFQNFAGGSYDVNGRNINL